MKTTKHSFILIGTRGCSGVSLHQLETGSQAKAHMSSCGARLQGTEICVYSRQLKSGPLFGKQNVGGRGGGGAHGFLFFCLLFDLQCFAFPDLCLFCSQNPFFFLINHQKQPSGSRSSCTRKRRSSCDTSPAHPDRSACRHYISARSDHPVRPRGSSSLFL